jgi:Protein of unknown function (DUF3307)
MNILLIITLLFTKHFIVDFPLQKPYQWQNKGTYGHLGGILHSLLHAVGTFLCFVYFVPTTMCLLLSVIDMIVHYHIDWAKMNINKKYGWGANTHAEFWTLLGLDQFLHSLTYIGLVLLSGVN